jgi:hypothetical protein
MRQGISDMSESLEFQIARSKIRRCEHEWEEPLIRESKQAQDCMDCEAYLAECIEALEWLERAEEVLAEAEAEGVEGIVGASERIEGATQTLYQALDVCFQKAESWIAKSVSNGYQDIKHLACFRDCHDRVKAWLERSEFYKESRATSEERWAREQS